MAVDIKVYYIVMKYVSSVEIHLSLPRVIELFDNPIHQLEWTPNLASTEMVSGTPGHTGAVSRLVFKTKRLEYEAIETILKNKLPSEFDHLYQTRDIGLEMNESFESIGDNLTKLTSRNKVTFSGLMPLIGWTTKQFFKKHTSRQLKAFKYFAENYVELT